MAQNEEKSEVKTFESSLKQISEDLERIQIYFGSNTSNFENEEKSVGLKVESSTEEISEDLEKTHFSSGDEESIHGDSCVEIPGMSQPSYVASDEFVVAGGEIKDNPNDELEGVESFSQEQEGDKTDGEKFTRTFSQKLIDVGPHPYQGRCFK